MYNGPFQGIFWFTCSFAGEEEQCDFSEAELLAFFVPGRIGREEEGEILPEGAAVTHQKIWLLLTKNRKDLRRHAWNYYPRGRVEIRRGKALIFMNPCIVLCENFQEELVKRFHLEGMKVRVAADCTEHYHCHGDDPRIL